MVRSNIRLEAVTRAERIGTVDALNAIIGTAGGWVEDFTFFSNISVSIRCAVPARNLAELQEALRGIDLKFNAHTSQVSDAIARAETDDLTVSINVTFVHDEPDLRRTIPSIPG